MKSTLPPSHLDQLLRQLGLSAAVPPSLEEWQALLEAARAAQDEPPHSDAPCAEVLLDRDSRIVRVSEHCHPRLGWKKTLKGQPLSAIIPSRIEVLRLQKLLSHVWRGETVSQVIVSLEGTQDVPYLGIAELRPERGQADEVAGAVLSVTELREITNEQVVDRQAFYLQILSSLPAPLALLDSERRYVFCNRSAIRNDEIREWIIGKTDEEYVVERGFPEEISRNRRKYLEQAIRERRTVQFEEELTNASGERVYQLRLYTPVFDDAGEVLLSIGHGMDITELRRTQEALRQLNAELEERVEARTAELQEATHQLQHDALHDSLTGLPNRALFSDRLAQAMARAAQFGGPAYAVLFLDVDRFKTINDTLGHPTGDALLIEMGHRLRDCLRSTDTVARLGGDEFTILLEPLVDKDHASQVAARIQEALNRPMDLHGQQVNMTASIGIVHSVPDYDSAMAVLRDADIAMYRAKDAGRAGYQVFNAEMREHTLHVNRVESELRQALQNDELRVFYQPVLNLEGGYIEGFEALVRWQHPERGLLSPGEFTGIAADSGLLPAIDRWVLREACLQMKHWQERYPHDPPLSLSINFCAQHLAEVQVCNGVEEVLRETGFTPQLLRVEITEGTLLAQPDEIRHTLRKLRDLGVGLHLDDFGTGYSSLSYLQLYPLDALKIDRSFVQGMLENSSSAELVRTIIAMAKNMNLKVVAEGIEQLGHLQALRELGCEQGQGYLFSHPLGITEARALVVQGQHFLRESWGYR